MLNRAFWHKLVLRRRSRSSVTPKSEKRGLRTSRARQNLGIRVEQFFIARGQGQRSRSKVKVNLKGLGKRLKVTHFCNMTLYRFQLTLTFDLDLSCSQNGPGSHRKWFRVPSISRFHFSNFSLKINISVDSTSKRRLRNLSPFGHLRLLFRPTSSAKVCNLQVSRLPRSRDNKLLRARVNSYETRGNSGMHVVHQQTNCSWNNQEVFTPFICPLVLFKSFAGHL